MDTIDRASYRVTIRLPRDGGPSFVITLPLLTSHGREIRIDKTEGHYAWRLGGAGAVDAEGEHLLSEARGIVEDFTLEFGRGSLDLACENFGKKIGLG